jgi:predicted HicB family RNase H-like nuclease
MTNRRKPGRPPRSAKAALDRFEMRITVAERKAWERVAKGEGLSLSEWARGLLNYEVTKHV